MADGRRYRLGPRGHGGGTVTILRSTRCGGTGCGRALIHTAITNATKISIGQLRSAALYAHARNGNTSSAKPVTPAP